MEWELFDLVADPLEVHNIYGAPGSESLAAELLAELTRIQVAVGDTHFDP